MWVQSGFSGWYAFACMSAGFCLVAQVWKCAGGERCVDLETQKEGKKLTPKGREAEVTSTVMSAGVASCHPQRTKPSRSKERAVSILQLGQSVFERFVVCWLNSERVMSAVVFFSHPKPERAKPSRSQERAVYSDRAVSSGVAFLSS